MKQMGPACNIPALYLSNSSRLSVHFAIQKVQSRLDLRKQMHRGASILGEAHGNSHLGGPRRR